MAPCCCLLKGCFVIKILAKSRKLSINVKRDDGEKWFQRLCKKGSARKKTNWTDLINPTDALGLSLINNSVRCHYLFTINVSFSLSTAFSSALYGSINYDWIETISLGFSTRRIIFRTQQREHDVERDEIVWDGDQSAFRSSMIRTSQKKEKILYIIWRGPARTWTWRVGGARWSLTLFFKLMSNITQKLLFLFEVKSPLVGNSENKNIILTPEGTRHVLFPGSTSNFEVKYFLRASNLRIFQVSSLLMTFNYMNSFLYLHPVHICHFVFPVANPFCLTQRTFVKSETASHLMNCFPSAYIASFYQWFLFILLFFFVWVGNERVCASSKNAKKAKMTRRSFDASSYLSEVFRTAASFLLLYRLRLSEEIAQDSTTLFLFLSICESLGRELTSCLHIENKKFLMIMGNVN